MNNQNIPQNQVPQKNPYLEKSQNIPEPLNNNINYPNYPENKDNNNNPQFNTYPKRNKPRPKSVNKLKVYSNYPYYNTEYPQRPLLNFGPSLAYLDNKFRTKPKKRIRSPVKIPYSKGSKASCFACDIDCGISRSGNSPNNFDPYKASLRKPRYDVTYYDGEKYGYYQYSSSQNLIPENN